jgi:hypothetical protein
MGYLFYKRFGGLRCLIGRCRKSHFLGFDSWTLQPVKKIL